MPLRTPREAVGKLAPLRNSQANSISQVTPLNGSHHTRHSCEEGNDSDAMSEGSFESELSSTERRLHHYALVSSRSSDVYDESISSDDEKFERHFEFQPERSPLDNYARSMQLEFNRQNADYSPRVGKRPFSYVQLSNKVGWGKHSIGQLRDVPRAFWPSWVYRMYDSYSLARKVAGKLVLFLSFNAFHLLSCLFILFWNDIQVASLEHYACTIMQRQTAMGNGSIFFCSILKILKCHTIPCGMLVCFFD